MIDSEECRDLAEVLSEIRRRGVDSQHIWCKASDVFENVVEDRRGLVLGGAWSPHFLRDTENSTDGIPWMKRLLHPRIVAVEKATEKLADWLPLMEAIAGAGESLVLATREISTEMLHTLIVNSVKGTLPSVVIHLEEDGIPGALGEVLDSIPSSTDSVPRAGEAWIRRTGTAVFPPAGERWDDLQDLEIVSVGGESFEHMQARLRYMVRAIQTPVRRF